MCQQDPDTKVRAVAIKVINCHYYQSSSSTLAHLSWFTQGRKQSFIGVLDIAGFEIFTFFFYRAGGSSYSYRK